MTSSANNLPQISSDFAFSEGGSVQLAPDFAIESSTDKVVFSGGLTITRDVKGLAMAESMAKLLSEMVSVLEADHVAQKLPQDVAMVTPTVRANPLNG